MSAAMVEALSPDDIHFVDGSAAVRRRIAAVARHMGQGSGIATEGGRARARACETAPALVHAHAENSAEPEPGGR